MNLRIFLAAMFAVQQLMIPMGVVFAQEGAPLEGQPMPAAGLPDATPALDNSRSKPLAQAAPASEAQQEEDDSNTSAVSSPMDAHVSINVKDAPITAYLQSISSQQKRLNFILAKGLENERVTGTFNRITVKEALNILAMTRNLTYNRVGNTSIYIIAPKSTSAPRTVTRIYPLNYITLASQDATGGSISAQDVTSTAAGASFTGPSSGGLNVSVGGGGGSTGANSNVPIIRILSKVLSKNLGSIEVEPRTNSLVITDIPDVFPQIDQILNELDKIAPQIEIEAQIIELSTDRLNEIGLEWGGSRGEMFTFTGPSRETDYLVRDGFFSGDAWKTICPAGSATTMGSVSFQQLTIVLRALISRSEARYVGKPRVVTMNNQPALISISRDSAVAVSNVTSSGGGGTSSASVERKRTGLTLTVTPQVNNENYVTMVVKPVFSDITASTITMSDQTVYDPISRGVSTIVRVKNGEMVVIGGLLASNHTKTVRKVPLFGYIPVIGWLFTSVSQRQTNTDLLILITPTILEANK